MQAFDVCLSVEQIAFKHLVPLNLKNILICPVLADGGRRYQVLTAGSNTKNGQCQPLSVRQLSCVYRIARSGQTDRTSSEVVPRGKIRGVRSIGNTTRNRVQRSSPIAPNPFRRIQLSIPRIHRVLSVVRFFIRPRDPCESLGFS